MARVQEDATPHGMRQENPRRGPDEESWPLRDELTVLSMGIERGEPSLSRFPQYYIELMWSLEDNAQLRDRLHNMARQVTLLESQQRVTSSPDVVQPARHVNSDPNKDGFVRPFAAPLQTRVPPIQREPIRIRQPIFKTGEVRPRCQAPLLFGVHGNDDLYEANSDHQGRYNARMDGARQHVDQRTQSEGTIHGGEVNQPGSIPP